VNVPRKGKEKKKGKKSAHLNTVQHYYTHTEFTANNHLNNNQNIFPNPIFYVILKTHQQ